MDLLTAKIDPSMAIPPLLYKTPVMSTKKPRIDSYQFSSTIINNNTKNECKHNNFLHELPPSSHEIHPTIRMNLHD